MRTQSLLTFSMSLALGGVAVADFGDPLAGLTADQVQRFTDGRAAFVAVEEPDEGLGPIFNGTSCGGCHTVGGVGGGSTQLETRFGTITKGAFDPLVSLGGSLIQTNGIGVSGACNFVGEVVPPGAIRAERRTTPLFGLGLVDAVPDATFVALARAEAKRDPRIAGRPSIVANLVTGAPAVGKFGWKAQVPNLFQFSADAYLNEMGITTPLFPDESCPQGNCALLACDPVPGVDDDNEDVAAFADFMSFLAPPPPFQLAMTTSRTFDGRSPTDDVSAGSKLFDSLGCASCHVRSLTSGTSPIAALSRRTFQPFSDFLLHDMGSLGDDIAQGAATGREMRTAPLWGLRLLTTFLHDGSASTIEDAILAHDGQGRGARSRFAGSTSRDRARLVAFLRTL